MAEIPTARHKFTDKAQHVFLHGRESASGVTTALACHHGQLQVIDYKDAIGIGAVSGHSVFRGFGRRDSLATTAGGDDLWEGTAVTLSYPNQSTGEQVVIVSTSANDAAAGSGVQQIEMHYLDNTGVALIETITLNGTTPVNSVATNVRFVQFIHSVRTGSFTASAAGTITVYKVATPATVYNTILAGENISLSSHRMVPLGKTFYMNYVSTSGTSNKPLSVRITATCDDDGVLLPGIFLFNEIFELQDSVGTSSFPVPRRFPALSIIKGKVISSIAGGSAAVSYGGWLEAT